MWLKRYKNNVFLSDSKMTLMKTKWGPHNLTNANIMQQIANNLQNDVELIIHIHNSKMYTRKKMSVVMLFESLFDVCGI